MVGLIQDFERGGINAIESFLVSGLIDQADFQCAGDHSTGAHHEVRDERDTPLVQATSVLGRCELIVGASAYSACLKLRDRDTVEDSTERARRQDVHAAAKNLVGRYDLRADFLGYGRSSGSIHVRNDDPRTY